MLPVAIAITGWVAALLILAAYALLTMGRLTADDAAYQWLNVAGAVGIMINSGWNGAVSSAALNLVWMGIGVAALWRMRRAGSST